MSVQLEFQQRTSLPYAREQLLTQSQYQHFANSEGRLRIKWGSLPFVEECDKFAKMHNL